MMKQILNKNSIFLFIIIALLSVSGFILINALKTEPIQKAIDDDKVITIAIILEKDSKPVTTEILLYYPGNARAALLDIPADTGLIIRSLGRTDRIDALYEKNNPKPYLDEIATLTGARSDWHLIIDIENFETLIDLLDGASVFIPNRVQTIDDAGLPAFLPAGSVLLDGAKMALYASYVDTERPETEIAARKQSVVQSLLKRIAEKSNYILGKKVYPAFSKTIKTNLKPESMKRLISEFSKLDTERLVFQYLTGSYRMVEGQPLLFPHYDGELVRDIVKQTLNALLNAESMAVADKVFTLEILNGTKTDRLAQNTVKIFSDFGYEVISVGNARDNSLEKTVVIDRYGDSPAAATLANLIRCSRIETAHPEDISSSPADFIIVLGADFNGRYCVDR